MLQLLPIFQLTTLLGLVSCPSSTCGSVPAYPDLRWVVVPALLLWVMVGAHDVFRLATVRLSAMEHRLFAIATGLRLVAGFLAAVGALAGITTNAGPAMLVAAGVLVLGSTWFEARARSLSPVRPELS